VAKTDSDKTDSLTNEEWKPVDSATATKAWIEYATPGEMHKMLAKSDGNWSGENTMWMENGGKPMISQSEVTNKMVFDGRYQVSNHKGNFMGMPFEGMSILAYDNSKKKFVSTWIDNMGTGIMNMEGDWNPSTKSIEFKGKMTDPSRPGKDCEVREVFTFVDDNTQKWKCTDRILKQEKNLKQWKSNSRKIKILIKKSAEKSAFFIFCFYLALSNH
jgi:hypothetical protein